MSLCWFVARVAKITGSVSDDSTGVPSMARNVHAMEVVKDSSLIVNQGNLEGNGGVGDIHN